MVAQKSYKYIYGPVSSWRLGRSLGIDLISRDEKVCTFDCAYCQLGKTKNFSTERKIFVKTEDVIDEVRQLGDVAIDYLTFSGTGEPTLAKNLGETVDQLRAIRKEKIAVITNSSLLYCDDVQDDLMKTDCVLVKLDACSPEVLTAVNNPVDSIGFGTIIEGIQKFRARYQGKFALQIMFVEENKKYAQEIARYAQKISPDEVQINTPLRPSRCRPLTKESLLKDIAVHFKNMPVCTVYDDEKEMITPLNDEDVKKRRRDSF